MGVTPRCKHTERMRSMKKMIRKTVSLMLACLVLFSAAVPAHAAQPAEDPVMPAYAVVIDASCDYMYSPDLTLYVTCSYGVGANSGVTRVDVTAYVEKRSLLLFWNKVDIGQPNNEWTDTCYGLSGTAYFSAQLPASGTYRVTYIMEIYKGSTLVETIEQTGENFKC